jgi:phospholipid-binding lipoprotein MlaA
MIDSLLRVLALTRKELLAVLKDDSSSRLSLIIPPLRCFLSAILLVLSACTSVTKSDPNDPWQEWNRSAQTFNDRMDDHIMRSIAESYRWVTPAVVDAAVTNFMNNINDILVAGNDLLQFKPGQFGMDSGRFMINTAFGLAGAVDIATHLGLPKHAEDFDQTLARWGIPSGPYLVVPLLGPSTPRGVLGLAGDAAANPINWITPVAWPYTVNALRFVDERANLLSASTILDQAAVDRYEFIRNAYLQDRNYKIYDGTPPPDQEMEEELDNAEMNPSIIIPVENKK